MREFELAVLHRTFIKIPSNCAPHAPAAYFTVEPVFANIRAQKGLYRFTLRSKEKVKVQWRLFSLVHNIEKIVNYGMAY